MDWYTKGFISKCAEYGISFDKASQALDALEVAQGLPVPATRRSLQQNQPNTKAKYPMSNIAKRLAQASKRR